MPSFGFSFPGLPNRMSLGVENHLLEIESLGRIKQQIEVLESFSKQKTLHPIILSLFDHVPQRRISSLSATMGHEVFKESFSHLSISLITGQMMEVVRRLNDLWTKRVCRVVYLHCAIVQLLRLDAVPSPHLIASFLR